MSSRTARATQGNPVSKKKNKQKTTTTTTKVQRFKEKKSSDEAMYCRRLVMVLMVKVMM